MVASAYTIITPAAAPPTPMMLAGRGLPRKAIMGCWPRCTRLVRSTTR